jgi:hypothetical protein
MLDCTRSEAAVLNRPPQFLVQTVTSLIIGIIYSAGLAFSKVAKSRNSTGFAVSVVQVLLYTALFYGGNWFASHYIDYDSWNATSIASLLSFLAMIVYGALQMPGKLLLARTSAWRPYFMEASIALGVPVPANERVAFARKCKAGIVKVDTYGDFLKLLADRARGHDIAGSSVD